MFDILHVILMGLLNLIIGLFAGIVIGSWDFDEKKNKKKEPPKAVFGEHFEELSKQKKTYKKRKKNKKKANNQKIYDNQNLTTSEEIVYKTIKKFFRQHGYSPTYRELCDMIGYNSSGTIGNILKSLKKKEYVDYKDHKSRTIKVIKK